MNALSSYVSHISEYIPANVKDAAGLNPRISEDVRHITWLSVERVFWPGGAVRLLVVLGYSDGFQVWDLQEPGSPRELLSKQDKCVVLARLLPVPLVEDGEEDCLGAASAPLLAYAHRGTHLVRLFSLPSHDDVHLLRLTEPPRDIQASRRFFAVGLARQADIYDALRFQALFSVQYHPGSPSTCPTFALGQRWLAYNLPPQQLAPGSALGPGTILAGGAQKLPHVMRGGLNYLGQAGQKTIDNVLMPSREGDQAGAPTMVRSGIVAVRDVVSKAVIAQFEDHTDPIEAMAWDPSGLQLVTCAALGHKVLVHRALLGAEHALVMHDSSSGGLSLGSVVFQHLFTLNRGYTPAMISNLTVSDDGQLVSVSSAKGTSHVYRLPPLHSAALGRHLTETGAVRLTPTQPCASAPGVAVPHELGIGLNLGGGNGGPPKPVQLNACTRVKLGSVLLQEGLMPQCAFLSHEKPSGAIWPSSAQSRDLCPRMYVATRAGDIALYSLVPACPASSPGAAGSSQSVSQVSPPGSAARPSGSNPSESEWQAVLSKEFQACRPLRHFSERRLNQQELSGTSRRSSYGGQGTALPEMLAASDDSPAGPSEGLRAASPMMGPRAASPGPSQGLGPLAASPRSSIRAASPSYDSGGDGPGPEANPWLSQVETATHVPVEVPLWLSPQLSFRFHSSDASPAEINAAVRAGRVLPGSRRIAVSRPERPSDGVRYEGASAPSEERLSQLIGGALSTAQNMPQNTPAASCPSGPSPQHSSARPVSSGGFAPAIRSGAVVTVGEAWGAIGEPSGEPGALDTSLEQVDGIGVGLEHVDEDWVKA